MSRTAENSAASERPALSLSELESALRAVDPAVLLVAPRIVRRVIKQDSGVTGIGLRVPHRKSYVIGREKLLTIVDPAELDIKNATELPDRVILLARPSAEALAGMQPQEALGKYWRQLFHSRVHLALDALRAGGRLTDAEIKRRVQQIGQIEFEEIRAVLRQEDYLLPPRTDASVYVEFVAVYLELRYFMPSFLRSYFPALLDLAAIDELLRQDVDGETLVAATRPEGCTEPTGMGDQHDMEQKFEAPRDAAPGPLPRLPSSARSDRVAKALMAKADRVSLLGNVVRAAILRTKAARVANSELARQARDEARAELGRLARRLQEALQFSSNEADEWTRSLGALVDQSARGFWTAEARMLYDLQKVCVDHERGVYALDVWSWATSLGRKPLKRFLPGQRDVLISKHLRGAARRLPSAKLSHRWRSRFAALLQSSVHRAEASLRARFKPVIEQALDVVKLLPQNPPERVARKKLVDELLDRIVERGYITMSDLRDSLSRNNLKLPDLASAEQLVKGDQLLLADKQLAGSLDGVYHAGETYLRWPQRLSSLAFGTPLGRFITLFGVLPFGVAFIILVAPSLIKQEFEDFVYGKPDPPAISQMDVPGEPGDVLAADPPLNDPRDIAVPGPAPPDDQEIDAARTPPADADEPAEPEPEAITPPHKAHPFPWPNPWAMAGLGLFVLGVLNNVRFRAWSLLVAMQAAQLVRRMFVEWPEQLLKLPLVRSIVNSWQYRWLKQYLLKPAVLSVLVAPVLALSFDWEHTLTSSLGLFLVVNLVLNTRLGRNVDEWVTDWLVHTWHRIRIHVFAALFRMIMDAFNWMLESIERLLYTVDEMLRFRTGESTWATSVKAVLGFVWFFVNYFIRFIVNLVAEPQLNPIKHFPVVTVSHKLLIPTTYLVFKILTPQIGEFWAGLLSGSAQFVIPGICGFLVWELKENWRLYAANRPTKLQPSAVGRHGETVLQFLKPGFRSGTIPKLYAKLRRASRKAYWTLNWRACSKYLDGLHHVSEEIRRFVDRDLLELLHESRNWANHSISSGEIHLGCNRILIELYCPDLAEESLWLSFEEQSGWLVASIHRRGWLDVLTPARHLALENALAGFYKMAGVELVREQLARQIEPGSQEYEITDDALVVSNARGTQGVYPLGNWPRLSDPRDSDPQEPETTQAELQRWVFASRPISWHKWVVTWELDQLGASSRHHVLNNLHLLPQEQATLFDPRRSAG